MTPEQAGKIEKEIDEMGWKHEDAPIHYNNEQGFAWLSGRNIGYIAGRSKGIEREKELEEALRNAAAIFKSNGNYYQSDIIKQLLTK